MTNIVRIGDATLYLGDCREILPTLPKVDLVLTDPPYGIGAGGSKYGANGRSDWEIQDWDVSTAPDAVQLSISSGRLAVVWGGNYYQVPPSRCWLSWDKNQPDEWYSTAHFELAWTNMDKNARRWRKSQVEAYGRMQKQHPTQKPVDLMTWCIDQAGNPQTILDPFMGSGTTGVACAQMGRTFTGIERERKYFDIACERIERAYAQGQLFDSSPMNAYEKTDRQASLLEVGE